MPFLKKKIINGQRESLSTTVLLKNGRERSLTRVVNDCFIS